MTQLGAGVKLDRQFDIDIDNTGDVDSVSGAAELEKDAAIQTSNSVRQDIGTISDEATALRLRDRVYDVLLADSRVQAVNRLNLSATGNSTEEMRVDAELSTIAGTEDLVFEL